MLGTQSQRSHFLFSYWYFVFRQAKTFRSEFSSLSVYCYLFQLRTPCSWLLFPPKTYLFRWMFAECDTCYPSRWHPFYKMLVHCGQEHNMRSTLLANASTWPAPTRYWNGHESSLSALLNATVCPQANSAEVPETAPTACPSLQRHLSISSHVSVSYHLLSKGGWEAGIHVRAGSPLGQGSANVFCKGPDSEILGFFSPQTISVT